MSMEDKLKRVKSDIEEVLWRVEWDHEAPLVQLRDQVLRILKEYDLIYPMRIHSRFVGVHPMNRYGDGIVPSRVLQLLVGIFSDGFSKLALDWPCVVEVAPKGNKRRAFQVTFNNKCMTDSGGALPPYDSEGESIKFLSVTCGHTTQTLRCVWHGVKLEHDKLAPEGKLSLDVLRTLQKAYAEAVEEGIEYSVIPWEVEEAYPSITELFQASGNQGHHRAVGETRMEVMLKIHCSFRPQV